VEHWNEEAGAIWMDRVANIYDHMIWLNPTAERHLGLHAVGGRDEAVGQRPVCTR